ncbi:MAG TPA: tetratricopeptide repeat protein [Candidatus Acidoferrales bacterium]|nr:tetratricopeptide repeat protein [Candidatus Acidoferrales bacterium]
MRFAGPLSPKDPLERDIAELEKGDPAAAVTGFTTMLHAARSNDECARIYNKRGVAHVRLGQREAALRDFSEALAVVPRFAPAMANIGNLLLEDGAIEDAIVHYEAAIRADESYAIAHLNLSVAYRKSGRRADAVRELRLAHRLEGRGVFRRR